MRESNKHAVVAKAVPAPGWPSKFADGGTQLAIATVEGGEIVVDLYAWLGVPPHATGDEIRRAYYSRVMALHPDRNPGDHAVVEKLKSITRGASILRNPRTRKLYDRGDIDAVGRLTEAGAGRRQRAVLGRMFGIYFVGPFAAGLALVTALLWTQASVAAKGGPPTLDADRSVAEVQPVPRPRLVSNGVTDVAPPSRSTRAARQPSGTNAKSRVATTSPPRLDRLSHAVLPVENARIGNREPAGGRVTRIAARDFEALVASTASKVDKEVGRRSRTATAPARKNAWIAGP